MNKQAIDAPDEIDLPTQEAEQQSGNSHAALVRGEWLLYGLSALVAVGLPLLLIQMQVPFIRLMDEVYHPTVLLQLYIFSASAVLTVALAFKLWQSQHQPWQNVLPFVCGVLVAFHVVALMRQHDARSWDYRCYEEAAQAIVHGTNPYGQCYIYVPTPAQALAAIEQITAWITRDKVGGFVSATAIQSIDGGMWDLVFYVYEATQLLLVILAFALCYRLARVLGVKQLYATGLVVILFLLNNPLLATLKHNQVNLWVLDLILLAILAIHRHPAWSGICVALGAHIKLYPLALLLPWALKRQWRGLFSAGAGMAAIFLLQTNGGRDLTLWQQFLAFADAFPRGTFFRDNSLHSLVYNTLGHVRWLFGDGFAVNEVYVSRVVLIVMGFLGLLYLWRFVQREQLAMITPDRSTGSPLLRIGLQRGNRSTARNAVMGHVMDALALALIASPVVWEHHYLLAMPIVIWGVAQSRNERQLWRIALSAFLIFVLPTFDVYPFSYHRLAGLLLLMATLEPMQLAQSTFDVSRLRLNYHETGQSVL
ncbi:MAG: DUF2029 domain-containing protein [Caldilineaceae bacterium]|nr:DUF2029 domain-containing protein [Caldilineaceae bacterium]